MGSTPVSYTYTAVIPSIYGCPSNIATTVVTVNPVPVITPSVCFANHLRRPNRGHHLCQQCHRHNGQLAAGRRRGHRLGRHQPALHHRRNLHLQNLGRQFAPAPVRRPPPSPVRLWSIRPRFLRTNPRHLQQRHCRSGHLFPRRWFVLGPQRSLTGTIFSGIASRRRFLYGGLRAGECVFGPALAVIVVRDCTPPPCITPSVRVKSMRPAATVTEPRRFPSADFPREPPPVLPGATENRPNITGLAAGVYSVTATITTANGACTVIDSVQVNDIGAPIGEIDPDYLRRLSGQQRSRRHRHHHRHGTFHDFLDGSRHRLAARCHPGRHHNSESGPRSYIFKITSTAPIPPVLPTCRSRFRKTTATASA